MAEVVAKQSLGEREVQEDACDIVYQNGSDAGGDVLMLVADGMGGHIAGEVASRTALEAFAEHFISGSANPRPRGRLREAVQEANAAIGRRTTEDPSLAGMGCTLLGALKFNGRLVWASVGDSILYLLRDGALRRLNADHSVYGELKERVASGQLSAAEAAAHPRRSALRSALIGEDIQLMDVNTIDFEPGDTVLLSTDGIDALSENEITAILKRFDGEPLDAAAGALLDGVAAKARNQQDNTTVLLYRHDRAANAARPTDAFGAATSLPEPVRELLGAIRSDSVRTLKPIAIAGFVLIVAWVAWSFVATGPDVVGDQAGPQTTPVEPGDDTPTSLDASENTESGADADPAGTGATTIESGPAAEPIEGAAPAATDPEAAPQTGEPAADAAGENAADAAPAPEDGAPPEPEESTRPEQEERVIPEPDGSPVRAPQDPSDGSPAEAGTAPGQAAEPAEDTP